MRGPWAFFLCPTFPASAASMNRGEGSPAPNCPRISDKNENLPVRVERFERVGIFQPELPTHFNKSAARSRADRKGLRRREPSHPILGEHGRPVIESFLLLKLIVGADCRPAPSNWHQATIGFPAG